MQFPKSVHAEGWHAHMPERSLPPMPMLTHDTDAPAAPGARRLQVFGVAAVALAALVANAALGMTDDPRPLDLQWSGAMRGAGELLNEWQGQLSHGLQVSLRAVADGREALQSEAEATEPPQLLAQARTSPSADHRDGQHDGQGPVRPDQAPRPQAR